MQQATTRWTPRATPEGATYYYDESSGKIALNLPPGSSAGEADEWCWVADDIEGWVPAKKEGDSVRVGGGSAAAPIGERKTMPLARSTLDRHADDLVELDEINEAVICHTLRQRHTSAGSGFYTSAGTVLIALNPYTYHPIYDERHIRSYLRPGSKKLPPHVFQVAGSESAVETQVLQANPLLEAFGNAKTVRNNNSSRFGRWIEVHFDEAGAIASARIEQYLLEKSRVVHQAAAERSYHIFYMLCESSHGERLGLDHPSSYRFLKMSGCYTVDGRDERRHAAAVTTAMEVLGFEAAEVSTLFDFLAGVLLVGNLAFRPKPGSSASEPGSEVDDLEAAARVAGLWGVTVDALAQSFTSHSIEVRGETLVAQLRPAEALDAAGTGAKHVYNALFSHIVRRVNEMLDGPRGRTVGVLDIFGFEIFEVNSFEQLCINFANEKLQQLFCLHTFRQEEELYREEEVRHDHVAFVDNQPVLSLIEGRPSGLLACLDDEGFIGPKGSDDGFLRNLAAAQSSSKLLHVFSLKEERAGAPKGFRVEHYAGAVAYDVRGFLEKNKDALSLDLIHLLSASASPLGQRLTFADAGPPPSTRVRSVSSALKRTSLGGQFRAQLHKLMDRLAATDLHFIRCIKPNADKAPRKFDAKMTLSQLRYAGVFETVAIRKSGYPWRMTLQRFTHWYRPLLLPRTKSGYEQSRTFRLAPWASPLLQERARQILQHTGQEFGNVQIGRSLVLYRAEEHRLLELLRSLALSVLVPYLQRLCRGHLARECRRRCLASAMALRAALATAVSVPECDAAASAHGKAMGGFARLFSPFVVELRMLRELRRAYESWARLERELESALARYVLTSEGPEEEAAFALVEAAMIHAEKLQHTLGPKCTPFQREMYEHARKIVDANAKARLTPMAEEALWLLDKSRMEYVRDEAKRVAYVSDEVSEIGALLALPEEKLVEMQLKRAVELQDPRRVQNRETRLRDLYVTKFARLYEISAFPRLRSPMEWAEAKTARKMMGKVTASRAATESRAARMLEHSAKPIHLALTDIEGADPHLHKEAVSLFKSSLAWAGERPDPLPGAQALLLLHAAIEHASLRPELYLQTLKQLNCCEAPEARQRYWELLALLLQTAPPGAGCEDFVHAFCLSHAPDAETKRRLIGQLHKARYEEGLVGAALPPAEEMPAFARAFFGRPMRDASRFSGKDVIAAAAAGKQARESSAQLPSPRRTSYRAIEPTDEAQRLITPLSLEERVPDVT